MFGAILYNVVTFKYYILFYSLFGTHSATLVRFEIVPQNDPLVFVRNKSGVPDKMSYNDLLKLLRGEKQLWENGKKVRVALMKTSTETGELVARQIYGMNKFQFQKYWLTLVFQGYATNPKFFTSIDDLKKYLSMTPGCIGILKSLDANGVDRIEVLSDND